MSNYCDEPFYQQNIYTNTYSLWENSAYYDINNLSPQNFSSSWHRGNDEDFETRYTSGPTEEEAPEAVDDRNRRIVDKASLYEDPNTFYQNVNRTSKTLAHTPVWTQLHWQRAGESESSEEGPSNKNKAKMARTNKIQKKIDKMMAKPVKMSKAESMMQKMGWHGGALGRSGAGIVEPIAPNTVYATKKIGFGQSEFIPKPAPTKYNKKETFTMNILHNIYEFVKNNAEVELLFDSNLFKDERKRIHSIINFMLNGETEMVDFFSKEHMDLVLQICDVNCYVLTTQSEGEAPDRRLCVYKEAPSHVYLIIPDDLKDDPPENQTPDPLVAKPDVESDNELEEETNPFMRSITRNLKKTKSEELQKNEVETPVTVSSGIDDKIRQYFSEFCSKKKYTQFKFLGPFNEEEWNGIRRFIDNAAQYLDGDNNCEYKDVFNKIVFEIGEDVTGNTVINKKPK